MSTKSLRGATLVEVLVVGSVFLLLLAAVLMIYTITARMESQVSLKSDLDRSIMAAARHVDALVKSSKLVSPERPDPMTNAEPVPQASLTLQPLKLDEGGAPVITSDGFPEWGDSYDVIYDQDSGDLIYKQQTAGSQAYGSSPKRVLTSLGKGSALSFVRPSKGRLEMNLEVKKTGAQDYEVERKITFKFRLFNQ